MKKIVIFVLQIVMCSISFSSSWPMLRFNYQRTGSKYEVAIPSDTLYGWSFEVQGEILASPVVKNNIVYLTSRDGSIWSMDAYTGEVLWQYSTYGKIDGSPVVWRDYVYVLSYDGKIYCFKTQYAENEDFIPLWSYNTQSKSVSSPVIIEDEDIIGENNNPWVIFVSGPKIDGTPYGKLYILDAIDGSLIKQVSLGNFSYSSLSYSNGKIYFTTNDGTLSCYDLRQQEFLWTKKFLSCFNHTCVVVDQNKVYLYAGDIERKFYVLNKETGEVLWSTGPFTNIATDNNSVTLYEDKILINIYPTSTWQQANVNYSSQTVICISTTTKEILWRKDFVVSGTPAESYNLTSPVSVSNNIAYFGTYSGKLYALNIDNGEVITSYSFTSPILCSVAISNGWIYFGELRGKFYGIKLDKFLSISCPDDNDVVINTSSITVLSSGFDNQEFSLEYFSTQEGQWVQITTGSLTQRIEFLWNTQNLVDGKYILRVRTTPSYYAMNSIVIDNSPLPPANLTAIVVDKTNVLLSWTKSVDDGAGNNDVVRYNIYRSTDDVKYILLSFVPKGTTFYFDTPAAGTTYYYKISCVDKHSESEFTTPKKVFIPPTTKPSPPQVFVLDRFDRFVSSATIVLRWEHSVETSTDVVKYNLYKSTQIDEFILCDTIYKTEAAVYYYIDVIQTCLTYYYCLTSVNGYDIESDSTPILTIFISSVTKPQPPKGLTVFDTPDDAGGNLTLQWLFSEDEYSLISKVIGYNIYKSSDGINFYLKYYFYDIGKTTYTYIDTDCETGVTFYYYLTAVNQHRLESDKTEIKSAFSISDAVAVDTQPPQPPSNVTAIDYPNDDGKKIILLWTLSEDDGSGANDVVKYKIYRSKDGKNFVFYKEATAGTTYYIDTDVLPNNTYWYYLTAVDKNKNESGGTQPVSIYPVADGIPNKPYIVSVTQQTLYDKVRVIITWQLSNDNIVSHYRIYKSSKTENVFYLLKQVQKSSTFYIDDNCEPQQDYYYYLTAVSIYGYESLPSETKFIRTKYEIEIPAGSEAKLVFAKNGRKLELLIGQGTLSQKVTIKIEEADIKPDIEKSKHVGVVYQILSEPETKFVKPVIMRIYYKNEDVVDVNKDLLRIVYYDGITKQWRIIDSSKVYSKENYVEAQIYHLSLYGVIEYSPLSTEIFKDEHVYAVPSPAKGDKVYFKFLLYQPAKVKVYVYDITGNFVWQSEQKEYTLQDVGRTHVIEWNIKNIATGVYIFRVVGFNDKQKKNIIKRFAIIH